MSKQEMRDKLKMLFRNDVDFSVKKLRALRQLGFNVYSTKRSPHYKMVYQKNGRKYLFVVSRSCSDWRAGLKLVSNIINTIYGQEGQ